LHSLRLTYRAQASNSIWSKPTHRQAEDHESTQQEARQAVAAARGAAGTAAREAARAARHIAVAALAEAAAVMQAAVGIAVNQQTQQSHISLQLH